MSSISGLERIPQELLDQILDYLEEDAPRLGEDVYLRQQPYLSSAQDKTQAKQQQRPAHLKTFSLVSKKFRVASLDRVFRRLQLIVHPPSESTEQYPPRDGLFNWITELSEIATFVRSNNLGKTANSFILEIVDGQGHYHVDYEEELQRDLTKESNSIIQQWHCLLNELPFIERLTIIAPPYCLGIMISVQINPWISEALHMPYHLLSISRNVGQSLSSEEVSVQLSADRDNHPKTNSSLLTAREWTSVLLNEGSFVRWHAQGPDGWEQKLLSSSGMSKNKKFSDDFCAKITSFEYVAIFPPPSSFGRLLMTLKAMPILHSFSFQIQPIGDFLYDSAQRESAHFMVLQQAIDEDIDMVLRWIPDPHGDAQVEDHFRELNHIQCLDQGSELQEIWMHPFARSLKGKWEIDKDNSNSIRKKDVES